MSYHARQLLAYLDEREAHANRAWWARYADRLTPEERRRLMAKNYAALKRHFRPRFRRGQWIEVSDRLEVRVAGVEPRNGRYLVRFDRVRDFRPPPSASVRARRTRESLEGVTTLVGGEAKSVGEPERMDPPEDAPIRSRLWRAEAISEAIKRAA